jgi:tetratricopeptide (TPR) repeat protein
VQLSVALVEHYFGWNTAREEGALRRAITLAPQWAQPYSWLGLMLAVSPGRSEEAIEMARHSVALEPLSANAQTNVALAVFGARRFEEADAEFRRALSIDPNGLYPLWSFAINCQRLGKHEESVAALERAAELTGRRQSFYLALLGGAYAAAGERSRSLELLAELKERSSREYVAPFFFAFVYVALGDLDAAIASVERGCEERNAFVWWVRESPTWDALRAHPRFPALLKKIVPA